VLALLGMADDPAPDAGPSRAPASLRRFLWLYSTSAGWWEPAVRTGEHVAEGQLLGTVSSLDGAEVLQTLPAPSAGVPMFITSSPAVAADGLLLGLGAT
jgi:predicted deacylase